MKTIAEQELDAMDGAPCPKCLRPECIGDCGLYSTEEKQDFVRERYIGDLREPKVVQLAKNPLTKVSFGSYKSKNK